MSGCLPCEDGLVIRLGESIRGPNDDGTVSWTMIPLLMLLVWCFMGVALIADVFMAAIEKITSKKARKYNLKRKRYVTVTVWNPTVANLTLMALGSSAPEILLSVIEICGAEFFADDLGPFTIVGSAAFNLLIIIGVCVMSIEDNEIRYIKEFGVYVLTAIFSLFAYFWLLIILEFNSQNVVEPWEGIMTFLFFPILVSSAYVVDRGFFLRDGEDSEHGIFPAEMTKEELAEIETHIRQEHGPDLTEEQVAKFVQVECGERISRARYRINATRALTGGKRVPAAESQATLAGAQASVKSTDSGKRGSGKVVPIMDNIKEDRASTMDREKCTIEFEMMKCAVLENAGTVTLWVIRKGDESNTASVDYQTREGTAKATTDFAPTQGTLTFGAGETKKSITVSIVDDLAYEEDEEFYIDLSNPTIQRSDSSEGCVEIGHKTVTVMIVDDDLPGIVCFPEEEIRIPEQVGDYDANFVVRRKNGSTGKVTCKYSTEDDTALAGQDFEKAEGALVFENGQMEASIQVTIKGRGRYDRSERFRVVLSDIEGGAKFDAEADGGPDQAFLTVFIVCEQVAKDRVDRLMSTLVVNWEKSKVGHSNWADQFRDAIFVNGGEEDEEEGGEGEEAGEREGPSKFDLAMHIITVPWKLLFACCPPTDYCGGWVCFCCSLLFIGLVTAIIGDTANQMGCAMCVPKGITAITFVALGTSLPDTFASRSAAQQDPHADASIVNVTGSNSVNVFLGLGLPWMMASFYWKGNKTPDWERQFGMSATLDGIEIADAFRAEGAFIVKAGILSFSVGVFSACAVCCLLVLVARRVIFGGELGGPRVWKFVTAIFLVSLWVVFIVLSAWKAMQ